MCVHLGRGAGGGFFSDKGSFGGCYAIDIGEDGVGCRGVLLCTY